MKIQARALLARSFKSSIWAIGSLAALLALSTPALAQHGGGGGGHGGGGGAHFGGGGGHFGGGGHIGGFAGHPGGFGGARGFTGGHVAGFAGGAHYAPRVGYGYGIRGGAVTAYHGNYVGRPGFVGHGGYGYGWGRGGWGYSRPYWGGGYWHGGFWPRAYYGWGYPWFLGALPAVYATYWWGGVPYYYANDVYYTWNNGYNGYVVTDPPPAEDSDTSAPADGGSYQSADPNSGDTSDAGAVAGGGAEIYAYPKSGQSDEQQATDKYECHKWAVAQSGFDPTRPARTGSVTDYHRAMAACMDGRGYSAR